MKIFGKWMFAAALAAGALGIGANAAQAQRVGVYVGVDGPAAYVPPCPGPGYVWVGGYWNPYRVWVPGYWNFVGARHDYIRGGWGYDGGHRDFDRHFDRDRDFDRHFDRDRDRDRHFDRFRR